MVQTVFVNFLSPTSQSGSLKTEVLTRFIALLNLKEFNRFHRISIRYDLAELQFWVDFNFQHRKRDPVYIRQNDLLLWLWENSLSMQT